MSITDYNDEKFFDEYEDEIQSSEPVCCNRHRDVVHAVDCNIYYLKGTRLKARKCLCSCGATKDPRLNL